LTEESNTRASLVKYPFAIALLIICIVIFIVWLNQNDKAADIASPASQGVGVAATPSGAAPKSFQLKPPSSIGSDTPGIVQNINRSSGNGETGNTNAPGLEGLLSGLEDKVRSDPGNISNRLLLAQTYNELGLQDKSLTELRSLQGQNPEHVRVNLILASILSQSDSPEALAESLTLLDKVEKEGGPDILPYLVYLYRGNALVRTQDQGGALASWTKALETMPASDNRRAMLEKRIADINAGG